MPESNSLHDDFPALSPDERKNREEELLGDEGSEDPLRLRQAKSWAALFDAARGEVTADEELVRSFLFEDELPDGADPEAVHILEKLQRDADPVGLFERLRNPDAPAVQDKSALKTRRQARKWGFSGWNMQGASWGQYAFATLLIFAVAYGGLFVASNATLSDHTRVAELSDVGESFQPPRVRGPGRASVADQYESAIDKLDDARKSFLGLFPAYDVERLDEAAGAFEAIREQTEPESAYNQEATLALARIRIEQERFDGATRLLDDLGASGGYRAPDAERLLDLVKGLSDR